ncbi:MAG: FadR family transcriptional regulator [Planctomycetes bacterium]|nr:FadR family transcriptional regulator [Planctomycetota bacterium]
MTTLQRVSTAEAIVQYFKNEIESGNLKQGDLLPSERVLRDQFGISRFSLREGLARLSALGIINIKHGKGAFISGEINSLSLSNVLLPFLSGQTDDSLNELFEARSLIEERVAELAAKRRSKDDLDDLNEILKKSEKALNNPSDFGELDYKFHQRIALAAGNVFFQKMLDVINDHVHSFLRRHAQDYTSRKNALENHWLIYKCIEDRNAKKINQIMKGHISSCMTNYINQVLDKGKIL